MKYSQSVLKLVAVATSVVLVGVYVGYRVLRADSRAPAAVSPSLAAPPAPPVDSPPAATTDPLLLLPPEELVHMGGSKSMLVIEERDVRPQVIVPRGTPPAAPDAPPK